MCELLAVAWEQPERLERPLAWAGELERLGVAGFGWGLAWVTEDGHLERYRRPTSLAEDSRGRCQLAGKRSRRVLVHLRRPSRLSTVQMADTQPFLHPQKGYAFAHNGYFKRHADYRPRYRGILKGQADSEVGFRHFDHLLEQRSPAEALREVHTELRGTANLAYLSSDGEIHVYGGHRANPFWTFRLEGATVSCTALHSTDESLFSLLFKEAEEARVLDSMAGVVATALGESRETSAATRTSS
jgi:predicted glutamine amidotransferase